MDKTLPNLPWDLEAAAAAISLGHGDLIGNGPHEDGTILVAGSQFFDAGWKMVWVYGQWLLGPQQKLLEYGPVGIQPGLRSLPPPHGGEFIDDRLCGCSLFHCWELSRAGISGTPG